MCVKIYRSTNMRYQQIAKLIMRNQHHAIRQLVQMQSTYGMPQHMSLVLTKLNLVD